MLAGAFICDGKIGATVDILESFSFWLRKDVRRVSFGVSGAAIAMFCVSLMFKLPDLVKRGVPIEEFFFIRGILFGLMNEPVMEDLFFCPGEAGFGALPVF